MGFAQQLQAGSHVASINNTTVLSPNLTWEQRLLALRACRPTLPPARRSRLATSEINLLGSKIFPQIGISSADPTLSNGLQFGPGPSFGNAGMFQNQWELGTTLRWVKGRHTLAFGALWDHTQLNIVNKNTDTDSISFFDFQDFVEGNVRSGLGTTAFAGSANRYYQVGHDRSVQINDNYKIRSNLTVTLGLRWGL